MKGTVPGIPINQREIEFKALLRLYRKIKPEYVVEIGSYKGGTLWYWLKYASPGAHVVSVDCGPECWEDSKGLDKSIWRSWAPPDVSLYVITGRSEDPEVIKEVLIICPRIDFLFIDGSHIYKAVRADYDHYSPLVGKGGIIALHDIIDNPRAPNNRVSQLFAELKAAGHRTQTLMSSPSQDRFGIGVIFI